jgi:hypothetical protein
MRLRLAVAATLVLTGFLALPSNATCGVSGVRGTDPGMAALNAEIDTAAAKRQVPPFLLKAIAWHESRWRQFYADGRVVLSGSCAIGVMQVLANGFDAGRLASDYRYNVDAGAQVLAAKMTESSRNVPSSLGSDDKRVAENWYRATYRYNGAGYNAMRYADVVFASIADPPDEIRPWVLPVGVVNPRNVVAGYSPQSGHGYVAHLDGSWASTLGTFHHAVTRGDWLAGSARMTAGATLEGDQRTGAVFYARNLGWQTWASDRVTLSTYPLHRASRLRHPSWRTSTRPVGVSSVTAPGAVAKFSFPVQAANPSSAVTATERFVPVVDGGVSMVAGASSTWTLNPAQAPTARITSAPEYVTDKSVDSTAPLSLSFSDPSPGSGVAYVQLARQAPGASSWTTPARVTSTSARVSLSGAGTHLVKVRAVDRAGHYGAWTVPTRIVVPRDDTDASLTFDGTWTAPAVSGSWLGSLASASSGASVTLAATGTSYALIGTRGPGLAPFTVYLDDTAVTVVDTTASATAQRQVLWEGTLPPGDHVLRVVAEGTAYLDAVAVT